MKTQEDLNMKTQSGSSLSAFSWLVAGIGIGAVAGILLAPRSGEDTREWISSRCKNGMAIVNSKVRQTTQQVGEWVDQSKHQVSEAVTAGREAYSKAKAGAV